MRTDGGRSDPVGPCRRRCVHAQKRSTRIQGCRGYSDSQKLRAVVPPTGSLLVIEFILPRVVSQMDPDLEGHLMSDLGMLAITGGRRAE